jgi:hypothetical protein
VAATVAVAGCGGPPRQDVDEPAGTYPVEIVEASFPTDQKLARTSEMRITVRNAGRETIPQVSVTVGPPERGGPQGAANAESESPFSYQDHKNEDPTKPIFVVNKEPEGGDTAHQRTWTLGALRPGQEKTFVWELTAVEARPFDFRYQVSAGLDGQAKAVLAGTGGRPEGRFRGKVDNTPPAAKVADSGGENIVSGGRVYIPRRPGREIEGR